MQPLLFHIVGMDNTGKAYLSKGTLQKPLPKINMPKMLAGPLPSWPRPKQWGVLSLMTETLALLTAEARRAPPSRPPGPSGDSKRVTDEGRENLTSFTPEEPDDQVVLPYRLADYCIVTCGNTFSMEGSFAPALLAETRARPRSGVYGFFSARKTPICEQVPLQPVSVSWIDGVHYCWR